MDIISQTFLFYGYTAAWIIVMGFVLLLVRRGQRIDKELSRLKSLVDDKEDKYK
jgi:CcmD family protein